MGIGDFADEDPPDNDTEQDTSSSTESKPDTSGSKSGGSSDKYPQYKHKVPFAVIAWNTRKPLSTPEGEKELVFRPQPDDLAFEYIKTTENASWTLTHKGEDHDGRPGEVKKFWWSKSDFDRTAHIVERISGRDLAKVIADDPEEAVRLINRCQSEWTKKDHSKNVQITKCFICREEINKLSDEYSEFDHHIVCGDHTVSELKEHDLI